MWRLISTWDRADGTATRMYLWSTARRPPRTLTRSSRTDRTDRPIGTDLGTHAATVLDPVVVAHGIDAPPQPQGDSVVWCSSARVIDRDDNPGDPGWCTDLWVHIDRSGRTIAVDLEGHGLAEHVTGRTHWDGPIAVDLADDLDDALAALAELLGLLCDAVIVQE
jgi:hypothetical protein